MINAETTVGKVLLIGVIGAYGSTVDYPQD